MGLLIVVLWIHVSVSRQLFTNESSVPSTFVWQPSSTTVFGSSIITTTTTTGSISSRNSSSSSNISSGSSSSSFSSFSSFSSSSSSSSSSIQPGPTWDDNYIHPIEIDGKHFVDSFTKERFFIKGVDYQPGGSAAYTRDSDPLSDINQCSRDIYLMQQLEINTVRIYTVNPKLDHDDCMTMLAAANIYLILDVNSPFYSESLNRYEPWTTYTPQYLRHIFEVVDQFSRYNNTLGFFIGNEIVNDERSAAVSPPYIRAVSRDVKDYMYYNCPRMVPIGYSAADDLKYRTQLPHYLSCGDPETAIDYYGVNSYQWCGKQTMQTSGYDVLVDDHADFNFPVFFSEFGCNHIQPRIFQEVEALYSSDMAPTFDGGLVYEFSQEENDYGLVQIADNGDAYIREEFATLKSQFLLANSSITQAKGLYTAGKAQDSTSTANTNADSGAGAVTSRLRPGQQKTETCKHSYSYLSGAKKTIPDSFGTEMIRNGVRVKRGRYNTDILAQMPQSTYAIYDINGRVIPSPRVSVVNNFTLHAGELGWVPRDGVTKSQNDDQVGQTRPDSASRKEKETSKVAGKSKKTTNGAPPVVPQLLTAAAICLAGKMFVGIFMR